MNIALRLDYLLSGIIRFKADNIAGFLSFSRSKIAFFSIYRIQIYSCSILWIGAKHNEKYKNN